MQEARELEPSEHKRMRLLEDESYKHRYPLADLGLDNAMCRIGSHKAPRLGHRRS